MKKSELLETLENLKNQIFDLDVNAEIDTTELDEITEKSKVAEIEKAISTAKKAVKKLETITDAEIEKALEKDGKKKVFKWVTLDGFYKMKLSTVKYENLKIGQKVSFRLDRKKVEKISDWFCYCDEKETDLDKIDFENGQDVCTITKIGKNEIELKSDNYGGVWHITEYDIEKNCVLQNGSNIAFLVYAPKTE